MKNFFIFLSGVLVAGLIIFGVGIAYAQTQTPPNDFSTQTGYPRGMHGSFSRGAGMMGGFETQSTHYANGIMHEYMLGLFAESLNMTTEELQSQLDNGSTMLQIAQQQGFSDEEFFGLMQQVRTAAIQQAVDAGTVTQSWADWMLQRMSQMWNGEFGAMGCQSGGWGRMSAGKWQDQPAP